VRQGEEDDVVALEDLRRRGLEDPLGERDEVGLERPEELAGVAVGGQRPDLDRGVAEQQAQQLAAGVPTGSGDRDPHLRHPHDYTYLCMFMHIGIRP
jgi:hypothetical protein